VRIVVATSLDSVLGGAETYVRALLPLLRARGHELIWAFGRAQGGEPLTHDPAIARIGMQEPGAWDRIAAAAPDVVYSNGFEDPAIEAGLAARWPTVAFVHNYYASCISGAKSHTRLDSGPCDRVLGPACLALYGPCGCGGLHPVTALTSYRTARVRQRVLPHYRFVLTASAHMRREVVRHGVPQDRARVLHLFATTRPNAQPTRDRDAAARRVFFLSRLTSLKGGEVLVDAVAQAARSLAAPLVLHVAGDGPRREAMEARARDLGVEARFEGPIRQADREALLASSDLLAVPSVWPEPFGLVGLEAASFGVPAVAFDVGGVREWLRPGVSGELAPGDPPNGPNATGLAQAIVRALKDPAHHASLSRGARDVAAAFSPEAHADGLVAVLAEAARA
jgi:glycosyltransferase involved in cell wall biosynthesis